MRDVGSHHLSLHDAVGTSKANTKKMVGVLVIYSKLFVVGLTRQVSTLTVGINKEVAREDPCNDEPIGIKRLLVVVGGECLELERPLNHSSCRTAR